MNQALNRTQKLYMHQHYWLPYEIAAFANARTPDGKLQKLDFTSGPFQAMIASRDEYAGKLRRAGWSDVDIRQRILKLYSTKRGKASPWDFLKIEYQPPKGMTDTVWAKKLSAKLRIGRTLGSAYGHKMRKDLRPRYQAVVRPVPAQP
jgi:hypothetical protein